MAEVTPANLVSSLLEKTKAGKVQWEPTAHADTFIASIAGNTTLKVTSFEDYGPTLYLIDDSGRTILEVARSEVWEVNDLFRLAQRLGNKVDEKMVSFMEALEKL